MTHALEKKLKTALDESRLLILGAQVLFGFQFQGVFQEHFQDLPPGSKAVQCGSLGLLLLTVCFLIAPSLHHQIVYGGATKQGALKGATAWAGMSLLPLALGLGASAFVVFEYLFGRGAGILFGLAFTGVALSLLYGLGFILKSTMEEKPMPREDSVTPLATKIEQMLTEARVIIPGGQALLGFQFVATLTKTFHELPETIQYAHAAGLCAVALAVMLLMTPAAVHRIAYQGEDNSGFFELGSGLVIAATFPLALGIAAAIMVVFYVVSASMITAATAALAALAVLLSTWIVYPVWKRRFLTQ